MAVSKQEVILEFNAETGDIDKSVVGLEGKIDKLADAITTMADQFGKVAEGANEADEALGELEHTAKGAGEATEGVGASAEQSGGMFSKMGKLGSLSFKAVGAAVAATGIGLLVKVAGMLVQKFMENKKVAEAFEVAAAALGAVLNTIIGLAVRVGEGLFDAFSKPQEVMPSAKEAVIGFADTLKEYIVDKIDQLIEGFGLLGDAIGELFSGNFKEAGKIGLDAMGKIADSMLALNPITGTTQFAFDQYGETIAEVASEQYELAQSAAALERQMQKLLDRERELTVQTAESRAEVEELKRQRDDERLSLERRLELSAEAAAIDQRIADENVAIQEEKARLIRQEIKLQGETEERLQELADAEIAVADAKGASAGVQTELMTNIYSLNQEIITQEQEMATLRRGWNTELLEGIEAEKAAIEEQYQAELVSINALKLKEEEIEQLREEAKIARDARLLAAEEAYLAEQKALQDQAQDEDKKRVEDELAREKEKNDAILQTATATLSALGSLNEAFGGADLQRQKDIDALKEKAGEAKDEQERYRLEKQAFELAKIQDREAKKQFERGKALEIADATIATGQAAIQAYKSMVGIPVVGPGLAILAAGAATAAGLSQIKMIKSQEYQATAVAPTPPSGDGVGAGGAGGAGGGATTTPQLDLSFLGGGAGQDEPIQAYVIASDVSNAQQANQQIQDQATL